MDFRVKKAMWIIQIIDSITDWMWIRDVVLDF